MPSSNSLVTLRRVPTPLLIVGGLHLAVIWALLNALQLHNVTSLRPNDMVVHVIDQHAPPPKAPPPPEVEALKFKFTAPTPSAARRKSPGPRPCDLPRRRGAADAPPD